MCLINFDKYYSFDNHSRLEEACISDPKLEVVDVKIKNPNNPVFLKDAKLIKFMV